MKEKPTLNWHFTTRCNFCCKYCFIAPAKNLTLKDYETTLEKIAPYFSRVNFVGGEPTESPFLISLMEETRALGLDCTIVTNGYNLIQRAYEFCEIFDLCSTIGISVDSLDEATNAKIGRCKAGKIITRSEYEELCKRIKANGLQLKINTVVSALNKDEDFSDFYRNVEPDRIKIFQCLKPNRCLKRDYDEYLISKEEFDDFVSRHRFFSEKIIAEDNDAMTASYYMLDSECCFIDEKNGGKSPSLAKPDVGAEHALSYVAVDEKKYTARYSA